MRKVNRENTRPNYSNKIIRNEIILTKSLLVVYLLALIWIILFKMVFSLQELPHIREINLIPFAGSVIINNQIDFDEIINNILIFIPFGVYVSMLKPDWAFLKKVAPISIVSLLFEVLQFIFAIGATDITDFIGNTLGGIIGIGLYLVFHKLFKTKVNINKIFNRMATIGTFSFIVLMGLLIFANK
ncbi:VanZ family protein [Pseudogracilibacillus sp. SE30717A]|uniref:VanZ family protein n=1 Tax=Pseudogracilibacillus sp. SE30717A TaxID=3098293 RepID=UPI00300DD202